MKGDSIKRQTLEDAERALVSELADLRARREALAARVSLPDQRLQRDALTGRLGADLQRLARLVETGQTTWTSVFEQTSPYAALAREHLTKILLIHSDVVRDALRCDPTFDPTADGDHCVVRA